MIHYLTHFDIIFNFINIMLSRKMYNDSNGQVLLLKMRGSLTNMKVDTFEIHLVIFSLSTIIYRNKITKNNMVNPYLV